MSARLTREDRWSYRSGMRLGIRLTYEHARFRRLRTALACLGLLVVPALILEAGFFGTGLLGTNGRPNKDSPPWPRNSV